MKYKLQDLINMDHFQKLQDSLNEINCFPSSIIDNDGNILTATAWQDICTQFHRKNKDTEKLCVKSDQYIQNHLHEANPAVSYRCPFGMVDNAIPIIIDGIHYGNFFTGQFFLEKPDIHYFKAQAAKYGFEKKAYLEAVKKVPIWTREQQNNYLFFIKGLIEIISESGLKKLKEIENRERTEANALKHKSILKSAMDGFWLTDTEGRLLEVNDTYCRMSGYNENELLMMRIPELEAIESPELFAKRMQTIILQGAARFESRHRRKDGTVFDVEISVQFHNEENGYCVCFLRDITDHNLSQKKIRNMAQRLDLATRAARLGIWDWDIKSNELIWDDGMYSLYGRKKDEFSNAYESWLNGLHPEDRLENNRISEEARRGEREYDTDFRILWPDGSIRFIKALGQVIWDAEGNPERMIGINYDITERKEIEKRLLQAQKMEAIGNLAGGIAHDFNNILFPIVGMSELLIEDLPPDSSEYENAREILAAGKRGSALVNQILAFSRQNEHKKAPVQVQQILREVLKLCRSTIPADIKITQNISTDCGFVMADATQLHQIAMNLITNAYHAVEDINGAIDVQLQEITLKGNEWTGCQLQKGQYVMLSVIDNGCGIPNTAMNKIFEPYFTTKSKDKGTGLGLAVVFGIVKEHDGDIKVYSEDGKGTTFNVYLPLMQKQEQATFIDKNETIQTGSERILLVDDDVQIARLEQQLLERLGYQVTALNRSIDALDRFLAAPDTFDVVITDMTMPDMTGNQLARELIAIRPDIPIIICTGFSERINELKIEFLGIKGFLMKPITKSDMAKMVRKVLDEAKILSI